MKRKMVRVGLLLDAITKDGEFGECMGWTYGEYLITYDENEVEGFEKAMVEQIQRIKSYVPAFVTAWNWQVL